MRAEVRLLKGRLGRRLTPAFAIGEARRIVAKVHRRLARPERKVVTLAPTGTPRGRALVSYVIDPFLLPTGRAVPHSHTHYWESRQIGWTLRDLGFTVDAIHWTNRDFVPGHAYDLAIDVRLNLERLAPLLGHGCLLIQHIETAHHEFHNAAQRRRLEELEKRRGFRLAPVKMIEPNRAIDVAHFGTTVGNDFTIATYAHAKKPILRVPISTPLVLPSPHGRDFTASRRRFLWLGSAGLVHKGLDLVLEAVAAAPGIELVVCGPIMGEPDFERAYRRELYATPNITTLGWVDVHGERFRQVLESCAWTLLPSCSEGGGGSVIGCMHGGLIPVVTREASVDVHGFGVDLADARVDSMRDTLRRLAAMPAAEVRDRAVASWTHVRAAHTRDSFAIAHRLAIDTILAKWESR